MRVVLLSGGSGKRLWPMSNEARSKQFLKVLHDRNGNRVSMLQRIWGQLGDVGLQVGTYLCASKAQRDTIENQIGPVPFIEEPMRRDTFPAIALSILYLADVEGCTDEEVVAVLPVDHDVDEQYFRFIQQLDVRLDESGTDLLLMGVTPSAPVSKFGYIRIGEAYTPQGSMYRVHSFTEKPTKEVAESLIENGALWNCGVFCFRIGFLKRALAELGYPESYQELVTLYPLLPKRSFDYEVVEQTSNVAVATFAGKWSDMGTWGTLSEKIREEFVGLGTSVDCDNTHVINEFGIPVVTMGLKDAVIVATPDGILAADKEHASEIKNVIDDYATRPMFEERRWGTYRVLDYQKLSDGTEVLSKHVELHAGKNISYQKHSKRSEVWTVVQGRGEVVLDSRVIQVESGDVIHIHPEQWHAIRSVGAEKLVFIEVQFGSELSEEDIARRYVDWEHILHHLSILVG
ncbi:sugar phosphate nucleotidyltransferase [Alicyclobacillus fastidiosus]|uniref:Sugar phosphate nucleotidyltransferase n=1 Tax=Alicyclobacillus fastidiosus TaxID=392011 RepID=A0ABY6ZAH4_9BACL|nr:sugar phosphate nucleotidyltransferase [Alicyclobacillus fastidiosus]WAH39885.1 sugar phosphate nucleotidyltransferase [Alicyclobacillus fastidiosus]GMA61155.1 mannose-1-phosphate guanylyltransferase [Alicyclobacillus fastidiosus]